MPYPQDPPRRGEIYWVDFDPARGSEQAGHRPACVISQESFNRVMPVVVVAAMTSKIKRYQTVVTLPAGNPLPRAGQILAFQVTTLDKTRLKKYLGSLTSNQIVDLKRALRIAWDL